MLRDLCVGEGGGAHHPLALHCEGHALVRGHAVPVGADVRLEGLPHLLLGVQLLVRLAWGQSTINIYQWILFYVFLYSVDLTEYVAMEPRVCVCLSVCLSVCVWKLCSPNEWMDFDEIFY